MSADPTTTFTITENDLEPPIGGTIYRAATDDELLSFPNVSRYPLDLTGATALHLILKPAAGGSARRLATDFVTPRTSGKWRHPWVAGETAGTFNGTAKGRIEITWPTSRPQTAPTAIEESFTFVQQPDDG